MKVEENPPEKSGIAVEDFKCGEKSNFATDCKAKEFVYFKCREP